MECISITLFLPALLFKVSVKLGASFLFLSVLIQTPELLRHNCSLRRLNTYLNSVAVSQMQKGFTTPGSWNCFQRILLKILPANTSFCPLWVNLRFGNDQKIWQLRNHAGHTRSGWLGWVQSGVWLWVLLVSVSGVCLGEQLPAKDTRAGAFAI